MLVAALSSAEAKTAAEKKLMTKVPDSTNSGFMYIKDEVPNGVLLDINDNGFKTVVLDSQYPVLVLFWASWSPPSRSTLYSVEHLALNYKGKIRFARFNVDEGSVAAEEYGVTQVPTILLFKNGKMIGRFDGPASDRVIDSFIKKQLK